MIKGICDDYVINVLVDYNLAKRTDGETPYLTEKGIDLFRKLMEVYVQHAYDDGE